LQGFNLTPEEHWRRYPRFSYRV